MKKHNVFGKLIALMLVALMLLSILPITAVAAPTGYRLKDRIF